MHNYNYFKYINFLIKTKIKREMFSLFIYFYSALAVARVAIISTSIVLSVPSEYVDFNL